MNNEINKIALLLKKALDLSEQGSPPAPARPGAGGQGHRQARAAGLAPATTRPQRKRQPAMPSPGATLRTVLMKHPG